MLHYRFAFAIFALIFCTACQREWTDYSSAPGKYSVKFPTSPKETQTVAKTPEQDFTVYNSMSIHFDEVYEVIYNDFDSLPDVITDEVKQTMLDASVEDILTGTKSTLISQQSIKYSQYPAIDFRSDTNDGQLALRFRVLIVGKRIYKIGSLIPKRKSHSSNIDKFFDSFKLTSS